MESHTLFSDEGVIAVVGVVGVSCRCTATITKYSEVEFYTTVSFITQSIFQIRYPETRARIALGDRSCAVVSSERAHLTTCNPLVSQIEWFAAHSDGLRARGRASQKCSKMVDSRLRNGLPRGHDLRRRETPAVAVLASGCQAS